MYQRQGASAFKADLSNTIAFCKHLGNPERKFRSVHIGGTNGKGSSSHFLSAILQAAGYKTGLYTSPHLKRFTERIKVDGKEVEQNFVVDFVAKNKAFIKELQPSFFEMTVVMAFEYFAQQQVDIAIIEVGMGGRLDSTNVINPEVSLVTNISLDHQSFLGNTLAEIAGEKAGIVKRNVPFVVGTYQDETVEVFEKSASQNLTSLTYADQKYKVEVISQSPEFIVNLYKEENLMLERVELGLKGKYQQKNLPGIIEVVEVLKEKGFEIKETHLRKGLSEVVPLSGLKGRWQQLSNKPLIICDMGHNEAGIKAIVDQLSGFTYDTLHFVVGFVNDKEVSQVLTHLPKSGKYYFCQPQIPRAMKAEEVKKLANKVGLEGEVISNVAEAIQRAKREASENDLIFIGGSTFVVAEIPNL
ncbi:folylpolyglutamate synthase/dihydrofolate synthase family protein [Xanthovirga aplysinae]|uniref:bifunctional folylpolyglutamate synthase/dihydrofolate synthase n=1 Tax=Xanthovirga aplysinae TaxID=2529853 RepID=UPI0031B63131